MQSYEITELDNGIMAVYVCGKLIAYISDRKVSQVRNVYKLVSRVMQKSEPGKVLTLTYRQLYSSK